MPGRLLRDPLVAFLLGGALLYAGYAWLEARRLPRVELTAATRAALAADFTALTGRAPAAADLARLERDYLAEELLFREALDSGLHLTDAGTRAELVEAMRLRVTGPVPEPTADELANHYAENLDRYRSEATVDFAQVYFTRAPVDPAAILARLRAGAAVAGDRFEHGADFPHYGHSMLRGLFGQPFVDALRQAPLGDWSGPLRSTSGWHFVRVRARSDGAQLPFAAVRSQVEGDLMAAAIARAVDEHVARLARRYELRVER